MKATIPDLTFFDTNKELWSKEVLKKIESCIQAFKENDENEATEDCLKEFFLDFASAKNHFINKLRDLPLIIKCRTKADHNSNFGGKQCAEFMKEIQRACDKYFSMSIYSDSTRETSPAYVIRKIREMADKSEDRAWRFEDNTKQCYLNTGKDNTLEIFNKSGYNITNM